MREAATKTDPAPSHTEITYTRGGSRSLDGSAVRAGAGGGKGGAGGAHGAGGGAMCLGPPEPALGADWRSGARSGALTGNGGGSGTHRCPKACGRGGRGGLVSWPRTRLPIPACSWGGRGTTTTRRGGGRAIRLRRPARGACGLPRRPGGPGLGARMFRTFSSASEPPGGLRKPRPPSSSPPPLPSTPPKIHDKCAQDHKER